MSSVDLHMHSRYSDDGELEPREITALCRAQGMKLIAIADHNCVRGISEAVASAGGLRMLSGVELDCTYGGKNFHLLGYGFDPKHRGFAEVEADILRQEQSAAKEKIRLFQKATGIPVDEAAVLAASKDGIVTGELIAEFVLAREDALRWELLRPYLPGGAKSDMPNVRFYWDFFAKGKPAYVSIHYLSLPGAAALIHDAGGLAVLAHPGQNLAGDDALLPGILSEGIDGMEVFSSYHSRADTLRYLEIAERNHLLITCGSDFHGKHKPQIQLGGHGALWDDRRIITGIENWLAGLGVTAPKEWV